MENALTASAPMPVAVAPASAWRERLALMPARSRWLAAMGLLTVAALMAVLWTRNDAGDFRVLFPALDEREAAQVVDKLTQLNIPHRLAPGSGAIQVPAQRYYETRMKLSSAGLPRGTVNGYELLDQAPFGQTQGQETANRQRALEGELVRTIQSMAAVESARVHLALPVQHGFFRTQTKPSASVSVALRPGRTLDAQQISGIVHLVSASVPDLHPKAVTVVDGQMELLTMPADPASAGGLDAQQLKHLRAIESAHIRRVLELLEPLYGRENVRATVTAELDFSQTQSTAEEFKPNQGDAPAAVRALRTQESNGATPQAIGIPGALSNQPGTPASAPINGGPQALSTGTTGGAQGTSRRDMETRYELDKKVSVTQHATGTVRRLNAAVVINHREGKDPQGKTVRTPLPPAEIERITALVRQGIGFDGQRGDSVQVLNTPFHVAETATTAPEPWWQAPWLQALVSQGAVPLAIGVVALALIFGVIRPALRTVPQAAPRAGAVDLLVADADALPPVSTTPALGTSIPPLALPAPGQEQLQAVKEFARTNPAAVAGVLRRWVNGEGR